MEQSIQLYAALSLLVIGLSHLFQPRAWVDYFRALVALGTTGAFVDGFLCLTFGGIVAGFHNVWHGAAIVLTLLGWSQVAKALVRFLAPGWSLRVLARASGGPTWHFRVAGAFALLLSAFLWWLRFRT
jgi:uncharacterized protein YjeT (DUF2065 family)